MLRGTLLSRITLTITAALLLFGGLVALGSQWTAPTANAESPPGEPTPAPGIPTPDGPRTDDDLPWCDELPDFNPNWRPDPSAPAPTTVPAPIPGSGEVAGITAKCKARPTITPSKLGSPARFLRKKRTESPSEGVGQVIEPPPDDPIEYPSEGPTEYLPGEVVRHVGAEVYNNRVLQILGNIEVTNPSVPHEGGEDHHFVARFLAEKDISGIGCPIVGSTEKCWIEVGWGEFEAFGDARYVYTYSTDDDVTYTYQQYPLVDGRSYHFYISYEGEDPPRYGPPTSGGITTGSVFPTRTVIANGP